MFRVSSSTDYAIHSADTTTDEHFSLLSNQNSYDLQEADSGGR